MNHDDRDIGPDNGKRPPQERPADESLGAIGTGAGYSGQEHDGAGQAAWRARQQRRNVPEDGQVRGSGAGAGSGTAGEDYDPDTAGGGEPDEPGR